MRKIVIAGALMLAGIAGAEEKNEFTKKKFIKGEIVFECKAKWITKEGVEVAVCINPEEEERFANYEKH